VGRGEEGRRGARDDEGPAGAIEVVPQDSLPAWMAFSEDKSSKPGGRKESVSNERLFHGGWKKQRKRR
jgi:hypothetical protein